MSFIRKLNHIQKIAIILVIGSISFLILYIANSGTQLANSKTYGYVNVSYTNWEFIIPGVIIIMGVVSILLYINPSKTEK